VANRLSPSVATCFLLIKKLFLSAPHQQTINCIDYNYAKETKEEIIVFVNVQNCVAFC